MKSQKKQRMGLVAAGALALGMCFAATTANATTLTASVGGVPTGADCYENFDGLTLGSGGGVTSLCNIAVSFTPDGGAVQGGAGGLYAQPVLSNAGLGSGQARCARTLPRAPPGDAGRALPRRHGGARRESGTGGQMNIIFR